MYTNLETYAYTQDVGKQVNESRKHISIPNLWLLGHKHVVWPGDKPLVSRLLLARHFRRVNNNQEPPKKERMRKTMLTNHDLVDMMCVQLNSRLIFANQVLQKT